MVEIVELEKPKLVHLKWLYGTDETGQGFFWPTSAQKRLEILSVSRSSPHDFEAVYQCRPGGREGVIFLSADLDAFYKPPPDLVLGRTSHNIVEFLSRGLGTYQAWDTAFSQTRHSAWTVCVTALFVVCDKYHCGEDANEVGPCEPHIDVYILEVFRKKIDWGDLVTAFKTQYLKWAPDAIILEEKASGISLIQSMKNTSLPIVSIKSNDSKTTRALNTVGTKSAGSAQGWFRQHRVRLPDDNPEWYQVWRAEMKDFSGDEDSTSDQVDATVHLIRHAIKLGSSMAVLPTEWVPEPSQRSTFTDNNALYPTDSPDPRRAFIDFIGTLPDLTNDPFAGTCSRCFNFNSGNCGLFNRPVIALDSCPEFTDRNDQFQQAHRDAERDLTALQH